MSDDISSILKRWPYDPDKMAVRLVAADDGRQLVQLRLDLGLLQMEVSGRPDGERVGEFESWFDHYQHQQRAHDAAHPDGPPFVLESEDCAKLLREGVQYYHRYLSFWHLECYEWCARDTRRNLQLFAFVREFARHQQDRLQFDQWRPYVAMMHARAVGTPLLLAGDLEGALQSVEHGIASIEEFLAQYEQLERADTVGELVFLKRWQRDLQRQIDPPSSAEGPSRDEADPVERLKEQLEEAIRNENYEEAARLRDEVARLTDPPPPSRGFNSL